MNEHPDQRTGIRINASNISRDLKKNCGIGTKTPTIVVLKPEGKAFWNATYPAAKQLAKQLQAAREAPKPPPQPRGG